MPEGFRAVMIGLSSALAAAGVIVFVSGSDSSPRADAMRPPASVLRAVWHDAPRDIPGFAWTDAAGAPARLGDFAGRPALLNLWATWCAPCIREMPMLDALAGGAEGAFSVIALNQDRDVASARRFWKENGFSHLALFLDPSFEAFDALAVRGLPLTLIVDAQGRETGRVEGAVEWNAPEIARWLKAWSGRDS